MTDKKQILNNFLPFYSSLTVDEKRRIEEASFFQVFKPRTTLVSGDINCSGLFMVLSGVLRIFINSEKGKELTLYRLFERDICLFSASCLFHDINFEIHVEAEENTEVLTIDINLYQNLIANNIKVANFNNNIMASRFSDVMWILEQIVFMNFEQRLAMFLLDQIDANSSSTIKMTHELIASHLGSAREVVSRMLKHFEKNRLVQLERGLVTVINEKYLRKLTS